MKMGNFPLMFRFLSGAASANSGGSYTAHQDIKFGTVEEYAAAEKVLAEVCTLLSPNNAGGVAFGLGQLADDGYNMSMISTTSDGADGPEILTMPYVILERFY